MDKKSNRVGVSRSGAPNKPLGGQTNTGEQASSRAALSPKSGSIKQLQPSSSKNSKVVPVTSPTKDAENNNQDLKGSRKSIPPNMAPMAGQKGAAQHSKLPQQFTKKLSQGSPQKQMDPEILDAAQVKQQNTTGAGNNMRPFKKSKHSCKSSSDDFDVNNLKDSQAPILRGQLQGGKSQDPHWKKNADRMAIYNLQKRFTFHPYSEAQKKELVDWKDKDTKGKRKTLYIKEITKKTDLILHVTEQSRLEQNMNYEDRWPLLNIRKEIMRIRIYINLAAKKVIEHKAFETISIMVILLNSITLAAEDPTSDETTPTAQFIDDIFLFLYSIEMVLKIVGLGFIFGKGAYLRDTWNILDFVIVGSAYLTITNDFFADPNAPVVEEGLSLNSLRAFRVLRPLRAITSIKGLRVLVLAVLSALPLLKETMVVLLFFFLIFAIAATQLLSGSLKQRCVNSITGIKHSDDIICGGREKCQDYPDYYCGMQNENPNFGVTNFDNIMYALLAVFQCITLEGWSDIQKMYQQSYSDLSFLLFLPIVFMGAFFLLNLTLAVINTSFNRTHKQFQEKEAAAKEIARKNRMKRSRSDETERVIGEGEVVNEIGVAEYFIAKRAARKMIEFYRTKMAEKALKKHEKILEGDELDNWEQEYANLGLTAPGTAIPNLTTVEPQVAKDQNSGSPEKASEMLHQGGRDNKDNLAAQEDCKSEISEAHSEQVKRFLQELLEETNNSKERSDPTSKPAQESKIKMQMIMNLDNGKPNRIISRAQSLLNTNTVTPAIPGSAGQDVMHQTGDMNNSLAAIGMIKKKPSKYTGLLSEESRFDDLLDIDKVIAKHEANQETRVKPSRARQSPGGSQGSGEHPFDLSFLQSGIHDYLEDSEDEGFEKPKGANNTGKNGKLFDVGSVNEAGEEQEIFDKDSVIGSDTSLHEKIQEHKNKKTEAINNKAKNTIDKKQPVLEPTKQIILKKLKESLKRMQTAKLSQEHEKRRDPLNNTQSTFDGGKLDSNRQMLAKDGILSNQMQKGNNAEKTLQTSLYQTQGVNQTGPNTTVEKKDKGAEFISERRNKLKNYVDDIDDAFMSNKGQEDPYQFIDKKLQKIEINRGIAYRSTSHDDVFEIRNKLFDAQAMSMANQFVEPPAEIEEEVDDDINKSYVKPCYEAWQLKNCYEIKNEEQVEFESDDEDGLILALQPYDTVMNVGFAHLLTQIPTKFRARRSDIIVSSTLSVTLSPDDGDYKCKDLALLSKDELSTYCDIRSRFRASLIKIFKFREDLTTFHHTRPLNSNYSPRQQPSFKQVGSNPNLLLDQASSIEGSEDYDNAEAFQPMKSRNSGDVSSQPKNDQKLSQLYKPKIIPVSLLSRPLSSDKILLLSDEEKKQYNNQKNKYDCSLRQRTKQPTHPIFTRYTLAEAKLMMLGKFMQDEDEDEQFELDRQMKQNAHTMYMSRDETFTGNKQDFEVFESALKSVLSKPRFDFSKIKGDAIPKILREEFDLPDDLEGNSINFDEIRRKDANLKRRRPLWSGQDVLDVGLTPESAEWVTGFMNQVRVWPKGSFGIFKRYRVSLKQVVKHSFFDNLMTTAVLLNTIVMAMERYAMPEAEIILLENINEVFTWLFIFEMTSKLAAIGIEKYTADRMNWLDGAVVCLSIMEIVLTTVIGSAGGGLSAFKTIRVLRTFRVLRVARLLRALESMQVIIAVIQKSAGSFLYITMLLFVFIFIFTLLGMQLFGGRFSFPDGKPRGNYDTFNIALVTVFQVLTMENWQTVLYDSMRSDEIGLIVPAVFYIVWIFVGNFILLNLFLAILLDSFLEEDEDEDEDLVEAERLAKEIRDKKIEKEKQRRMKKLGTTMFKSGSYQQNQTLKQADINKLLKKSPVEVLVEDIDDLEEQAIREIFMDEGIIKKKDKERERKKEYLGVDCENSLYIMKKENFFRKSLYLLQRHKLFDNTIMFLIGISSMKLGADTFYNNYPTTSTLIIVSGHIDLFLNFAFLFECVTKVCALGFVMDDGSYLRESWNQLDLFIVVTSMMDMLLSGVDLPIIKILRLLRTLRPLRVISHNVAMKLIVSSLMESVGAIFNVVIVVVAVWLMFAIFAINIFAGKFFYCTHDIYQNHDKYECNVAGGSWVVQDSNFDNVFQAMMTLFIVASLEGWPDIMLAAVDSTEVDHGPDPEASPMNAYFFLLFILIGSFFLLNFFIGVLFLKYAQAQKNENKGYTPAHLTWKDIQSMIVKAECPHDLSNKPTSPLRIKVWKLVGSDKFDIFIMATIVLNIIQMAVSYQGQPQWYTGVLEFTNYIFTIIFLGEAILKLTAFGWSYFGTAWNKFDFFVVTSSLLDLAMDQMDAESMEAFAIGPQLAKILRVLRVTRVLRLAGKNEGLQALMQTITMSIGALANVFLLLVLVLFIFSVLGVFFFQELNSGDVIDEYKNFNNFAQSFLLLFAISTGEDWNKLMYDCVDTPPNCIAGETCGSSLAPAYFIVFIMVVSNVMLNLFILVIIQQFELYYVSDDNPILKFKTNLDLFMSTWVHFTAKRYKCIKIREKQLHDFFKKLPVPIGMPDDTTEAELKKTMLKMGIRCDDGYIYFNELLYRCMRRQYGTFKLNKRMQIVELRTQYKIYFLTLRSKNQSKLMKNQELFFEKMIGNDKAVNPFVQKMYYRISFHTWLNVMRKQERRDMHDMEMEQKREQAMLLGMPFIEQELQEEAAQYEHVTYEVEELKYWTSEEEDDEEPVERPKSGISQKLLSAAGRSNNSLQKSQSKASKTSKRMKNKLSTDKLGQSQRPDSAIELSAKSPQ